MLVTAAAPGGEVWRHIVATTLPEMLANSALLALLVTLLAGSAASRHLTFVQRSRLWGFPDVITVETLAAPGGSLIEVMLDVDVITTRGTLTAIRQAAQGGAR